MSSKDQCLADALNDLRNANLAGEARGMVGFVGDYFVYPRFEGDDVDLESDSKSESGSKSTMSSDSGDEFDQGIEEEVGPLVNVDILSGDEIVIEANGALEVDERREKASNFQCGCKLLNDGPCSRRYSADDFCNSQCEIAELSRGKLSDLCTGPSFIAEILFTKIVWLFS